MLEGTFVLQAMVRWKEQEEHLDGFLHCLMEQEHYQIQDQQEELNRADRFEQKDTDNYHGSDL